MRLPPPPVSPPLPLPTSPSLDPPCATSSYHCLDESLSLLPHLPNVSEDVEDAVLLRQLDVSVDGQVHAGAPGAVTDLVYIYILLKRVP